MAFFEELSIGDRFETPGTTMTADRIVRFARVNDQQLFHINLDQADDAHFGGLIASGIQTMQISFALFFGLNLVQEAAFGGAGIDRLRWKKPVRADDTIRVICEVLDCKTRSPAAGTGLITMRHDTLNQHDDVVMTMECHHILKKRHSG